jgi:hypothetical protein
MCSGLDVIEGLFRVQETKPLARQGAAASDTAETLHRTRYSRRVRINGYRRGTPTRLAPIPKGRRDRLQAHP